MADFYNCKSGSRIGRNEVCSHVISYNSSVAYLETIGCELFRQNTVNLVFQILEVHTPFLMLAREDELLECLHLIFATKADSSTVVSMFNCNIQDTLVFRFVDGNASGGFYNQTKGSYFIEKAEFRLGLFRTHVCKDAF